jgi:hypothetical protein
MSAHHAEFQERLLRIQSGQGFTKATVYVGQETAFSYVPVNRRRGGMLGQLISNAGYALSFPFCVAVGVLCHGAERLAEFLLAGLPDPNANPDVEMAKVAVTGFLLTVVVTHLLGLRDKGLLVPKLLGVAGGMLFFHNLVHLWPQVFEPVFSKIWVAQITSMTEPASLLWRGISFPF